MIEPDIKQLVERAIRGDDDAFAELYRRKSWDIFCCANRVIADRDDAEDAAQEAVLIMYQSIRRLQRPEAFYAWMHRIIARHCFRFLRLEGEEKADITLLDNLLTEERFEFLPDEYLQRKNIRDKLLTIIGRLPLKRRDAVILYYYDDLSYTQIARVMNISISAVSTSLLRARNDIRKELEKESGTQTENPCIPEGKAI
ncbi:MAG: RNA polymerase sigma factor [Clostridiales Family XIII bacterium]|nr:RNA polymerase sigma factor [Clostridiales Family XIII bacterium]